MRRNVLAIVALLHVVRGYAPACRVWHAARAPARLVMSEAEDDAAEFAVEYTPPPPPPAAAVAGMSPCTIKVIGVGGGGGNTLNRMVGDGPGEERTSFLEFIAANTDIQALSASLADSTIVLGKDSARGLGAGGKPAVGRASAIDTVQEIEDIVSGSDMVFVTAGMGGGTGSGAAPVVAEVAKSSGCLTVGIVTKPFTFEGRKRTEQALAAIADMQAHVDILIVVSNDKVGHGHAHGHVHVHVHLYVHVHVHVRMWACACGHVHLSICMRICMCMCMCAICACACGHVGMCMWACACACACAFATRRTPHAEQN